jgi:hypothetical protein
VLIGIFAATRGRRRLDGELKRLERIRERGRTETLEALHELHIYRERIRGMLARGRVQDGQYAILTTHVRETLDVLRERILGGLLDRLSRPFLSAFDIALRDGRVDADEAHTLLALVDREKLPAAERRRLALLIAAWQAR